VTDTRHLVAVGASLAGLRAVEGSADGRLVALCREGDRLVGALIVDAPTHVLK
jgi:hypothetical protein